jgi:hypothetical protein
LSFNKSGGFFYHWRALRYQNSLWSRFKKQVEDWLGAWPVRTDSLVLIGPSGGYSLPREFLLQFKKIDVIEPDFWARFILQFRFRGVHFNFIKDYDLLKNKKEDRWQSFLQKKSGSSFLFCNVLGQLAFIDPLSVASEKMTFIFENLERAGVCWASYHDVLSTAIKPKNLTPLTMQTEVNLESAVEFLWSESKVIAIDHGTWDATSKRQPTTEMAWWQLSPGEYHLIAWIFS